jgi:hypothetical protein
MLKPRGFAGHQSRQRQRKNNLRLLEKKREREQLKSLFPSYKELIFLAGSNLSSQSG